MRETVRPTKLKGLDMEGTMPLGPSPSGLREPEESEQQCTTCGLIKPKTLAFFKRKQGTSHALMRVCRTCQAKARQRKQLDAMERTAIKQFVGKAGPGGVNIPHSAELLESILGYFGGTNGFSSMLLKQYWDAAPGSKMRSGILEMIVRLTAKNTEQGGARRPVDLYTEEELLEEMEKRIMQQAAMIVEVQAHGETARITNEEAQGSGDEPDASGSDAEHVDLPEGRDLRIASGVEEEADGGSPSVQAEQ